MMLYCPYCDSDAFGIVDSTVADGEYAEEMYFCSSCHKHSVAVYKFSHFEDENGAKI